MNTNKNMLFHLPFRIDKNRPVASQIRPVKMMEAFKAAGYNVFSIMGYGKKRKKQIREVKKNIRQGIQYEFVYSESSTMPTSLTEKNHFPLYHGLDFRFFKFCKKHKISIGLFYRDICWKKKEFGYHAAVPFLKRTIARFFYKYDLRQYNRCLDILFLPALIMSRELSELKKIRQYDLPSG